MHSRRGASVLAVLIASSVATLAVAGPLPPAPVSGATPVRVTLPVTTAAYPVYGPNGRRTGSATWRTSTAGGNCCETYVSATPTGRIVESGGTYPWYTDDRGRTWYQVRFDLPDQNDNGKLVAGGEGATVIGSGGDVYGVMWDAYSGDHLQSYRYDAQTGRWQVSEVVMKTPFYDRPWLTYARGPITLDGTRTRQVLDVTGGGITKDVDTLSADGLDYGDPSFFYYDERITDPVPFRVPVVRNPDADWWQPHPGAGTLPLSGGGVLRFATGEYYTGDRPCDVARLDPATAAWQCVTTRSRFAGVVRQDSRGFLTEVYPGPMKQPGLLDSGPADGPHWLVLRTSRDGGLHWRTLLLRPPRGAGTMLETPEHFDVVANGRLRQAVVSARFDDAAGHGQDMVFRVSTASARPRLLATYLVGKGDVVTANDASGSAGYRFDYSSVTLLPDGTIATSFDDSTCLDPGVRDSTHRSPQVAVLL
jgi:hypothetical protein